MVINIIKWLLFGLLLLTACETKISYRSQHEVNDTIKPRAVVYCFSDADTTVADTFVIEPSYVVRVRDNSITIESVFEIKKIFKGNCVYSKI